MARHAPNNGRLEIRGGDKVKISYRDIHTSAGAKENKTVIKEIPVVSTAIAAIMDGAYSRNASGVVLGRGVNLQIFDADLDLTDGADILKAAVEVYREKTQEELAAEAAPAATLRPRPIPINSTASRRSTRSMSFSPK